LADGLDGLRIVVAGSGCPAHRPADRQGLLDESAGFAFPADLHMVAPDQDRHRG
jgi:hypothetical protein